MNVLKQKIATNYLIINHCNVSENIKSTTLCEINYNMKTFLLN